MKAGPDTVVEELLERHPELNRVFVRLGLSCFVCGEPVWGTVGELCGRFRQDPDQVVAALNAALESGN